MNERFGVGVAVLSCSFGAGAAVATRYLDRQRRSFHNGSDPLRRRLSVRPAAGSRLRAQWPRGRDRIAVAGLGFMFFAVFFVFYNVALR